jgi:hypothetical protein
MSGPSWPNLAYRGTSPQIPRDLWQRAPARLTPSFVFTLVLMMECDTVVLTRIVPESMTGWYIVRLSEEVEPDNISITTKLIH